MRAVLCHAFGKPDGLRMEEIKPVTWKKVMYASVCALLVSIFQTTSWSRGNIRLSHPCRLRRALKLQERLLECAPDIVDLHLGQRVIALARRGGAFASELTLPAAFVVPIPDVMDFTTAAGFPVAYGTAHLALTHRGHLQSGETLLVTGAGGGVGLAAVEVGKRLAAQVIAAAAGADKLKIASKHGADDLIDYRADSLRDRIKELMGDVGVDVVFEPVGGDIFDQCTA